jgi:hypothetical protein
MGWAWTAFDGGRLGPWNKRLLYKKTDVAEWSREHNSKARPRDQQEAKHKRML